MPLDAAVVSSATQPVPTLERLRRAVALGASAVRVNRAAALLPRRARPALWPGADAAAVLRRGAADPARIMAGTLAPSEAGSRLRLLWCAAAGRF